MIGLVELVVLVAAIVLVFGGLALINLWIGATASWLWLMTIRPVLVILVTLAILIAIEMVMRAVFSLDIVAPLDLLIGLIATPIAAVPLANFIAFRRAPDDRRDGVTWRNFIFADKRRSQSEEYLAPTVAR